MKLINLSQADQEKKGEQIQITNIRNENILTDSTDNKIIIKEILQSTLYQ